jgi:uncharacterized membrane protein YqaE (UPF0057 family)
MKTKKLLSASFFLALAILFASCGTSVDIAKRQFNDGYYVHVSKNKHTAEKNETTQGNSQSNPAAELKQTDSKNVLAENKNVTPAYAPEKIENKIDNSVVASVNHKPALSAKKACTEPSRSVFSFAKNPQLNSLKNDNANSETRENFSGMKHKRFFSLPFTKGTDVPQIVLILLCLFLPFIAVGLVDNWGTRFWIDLLLCVLFYIPGIIYAFIVCFG